MKYIGPITLPLRLISGGFKNFKLTLATSNKGDNYHILECGKVADKENVIVRIESACTYAHLYGSSLCDCDWQLKHAIEKIAKAKQGLLIYALDQHGRGVGLTNHVKVYMAEQQHKLDTVEAHTHCKLPIDARNYEDILCIFRRYKLSSIRLLTNNPHRLEYFSSHNIKIKRIPLEAPVDKYNHNELSVKAKKMGHLLSAFDEED